jgi:hypothetical protein
MLGGGTIAWSSKKQSQTALSTAEAEYVTVTHTVKQLLWHRNLLRELDVPQAETSILQSDNQAAIAILQNPQFHTRTKHIDIDLHFLRDYVESGELRLTYVPSKENLTDIFTKALPRPAHEKLTSMLGITTTNYKVRTWRRGQGRKEVTCQNHIKT